MHQIPFLHMANEIMVNFQSNAKFLLTLLFIILLPSIYLKIDLLTNSFIYCSSLSLKCIKMVLDISNSIL